MGEETSTTDSSITLQVRPAVPHEAPDSVPESADELAPVQELDRGRRRFVAYTAAGIALAAVPMLWILWGLWGPTNLLRTTAYENNFYDLQARAMMHGHLWLANGSIGIEAFVHGGHQFTYFGLFPSLIRLPILLVTSRLDGKLSAPFILLAWLLTALFTILTLWRVRVLVRGSVVMGKAEAASFGLLTATIMGGSVFSLLAATPYVFAEDLAWSICLTIGSLFALLGVLERPSWWRVLASLALILAANLDRVTTGWACAGAALLIAAWFGMGRGGGENRRWWLPVLFAGLLPLLIGCAFNYAKFGVPFGVSNFDQVFTRVNAYRRQFLAANHNSEAGTTFIPSTMLAYLRPDGLRITGMFPFITLPATPPASLGGVLFDRRYRTASLPSSMPLLFLLSLWGLVTAFRPRPVGRVALTRILLFVSLLAGAALFGWGYIAPRYLADFMPFLVLASAVALVDVWRRLRSRSRSIRLTVLAAIACLALFSVVANFGMAITPNEEWNTAQVHRYVEVQKAFSDLTGHSLTAGVQRGNALPPWGPADQLYVIGSCNGFYISNGEYYSTVPSQQFERTTWMAVELGHLFQHTYSIAVNKPADGKVTSLRLVSAGSRTLAVVVTPTTRNGLVEMYFSLYGRGQPAYGEEFVRPGSVHRVVVITDPAKHLAEVTVDGAVRLNAPLVDGTLIHDFGSSRSRGKVAALSVSDETAASPEPRLCRSINR